MTATPPLRSDGRADLLALAPVMLGFQPHESLVVLGIAGHQVDFCVRVALADPELEQLAAQVREHLPLDGRVAVLAFSATPQAAAAPALALADMVDLPVLDVIVTDGEHLWSLLDRLPDWSAGEPFDYRACSLSAQAVVGGLNVAASREEEVDQVASLAIDVNEFEDAVDVVSSLETDERLRRLEELVESVHPLTSAEACELGALLGSEEALGCVMARLTTRNAPRIRVRLAEARRRCPVPASVHVVALLALACWLSGRPAQMNACLEQLGMLAPDHPVVSLLLRLTHLAIPPSRWDEA